MVREEFLKRTLAVQSLLPTREALGLATRPLTERVLCSLFQRIQEHYPTGLKRLQAPQIWTPTSNLSLGNQALFQLNIVSPKMENSILGLFQKTHTTFGRRAMRQRLLYPTANGSELLARYAEIAAVQGLPQSTREIIKQNLRQIEDLPRIHRRIAEGGITAGEITLLDKSYQCSQKLAEAVGGVAPLKPATPLEFAELFREFHGIFSIEKAGTANENAFCFQDAAAPEVSKLEREIRELYETLNSALREISKWAWWGVLGSKKTVF
jgi:DNA mismatch repair ATPase MutS